MGVIALLFFLVIDLPDAGQVGTLDDARQSFIDAEAVPQSGFWLEMLGALGLAFSGGALATMTPEQLESLRGKFFRAARRSRRRRREGLGGEEGSRRSRGESKRALGVAEGRSGAALPLAGHRSGEDRRGFSRSPPRRER